MTDSPPRRAKSTFFLGCDKINKISILRLLAPDPRWLRIHLRSAFWREEFATVPFRAKIFIIFYLFFLFSRKRGNKMPHVTSLALTCITSTKRRRIPSSGPSSTSKREDNRRAEVSGVPLLLFSILVEPGRGKSLLTPEAGLAQHVPVDVGGGWCCLVNRGPREVTYEELSANASSTFSISTRFDFSNCVLKSRFSCVAEEVRVRCRQL
jgi:hypothetical protein